jgi:hypothetical protein
MASINVKAIQKVHRQRTSLRPVVTTYFTALKLFNWHKVARSGRLIKLLLGSHAEVGY